jgi:hypothetical protein
MLDYMNWRRIEANDPTKRYDPKMPQLVMSGIVKQASDTRCRLAFRNVLGYVVISPGMVFHPSNFIRYLEDKDNFWDIFHRKFYVPFANYEEELMWSLRNVSVSEIIKVEMNEREH